MGRTLAVIFDGDGVLFDTIPSHRKIQKLIDSEFPDLVYENKGRNATGFLRDLLKSRGMPPEQIEAALTKYLARWEERERELKPRIFSATNDTLAYLKSKKIFCGALTNRAPRNHNLRFFKDSGLDLKLLDFFILHKKGSAASFDQGHEECIYDKYSEYTYCLTPFAKPNPFAIMPVHHELSRLSGYPRCVVMWGDNIVDMEFAKGNGYKFVGVLSGVINNPDEWIAAGLHEASGDRIVKDISELTKIF